MGEAWDPDAETRKRGRDSGLMISYITLFVDYGQIEKKRGVLCTISALRKSSGLAGFFILVSSSCSVPGIKSKSYRKGKHDSC